MITDGRRQFDPASEPLEGLAEFAQALEPYLNETARSAYLMREREQAAAEPVTGESAGLMRPPALALEHTPAQSPRRPDTAPMDVVGSDDGRNQIPDGFLANLDAAISAPSAQDDRLELQNGFGTHAALAAIPAGWASPQVQLTELDSEQPRRLAPFGLSPTSASASATVGQPVGAASFEPVEAADPLRRVGDIGHSLADVASFFPTFEPPDRGSPASVSAPISAALADRSGSWDSGWMPPTSTFGTLNSPGMSDSGPAPGPAAWSPGFPGGADSMTSESVGELTSRLAAAAGRLEEAAQRIAAAGLRPLASPPRRFRGRVDE